MTTHPDVQIELRNQSRLVCHSGGTGRWEESRDPAYLAILQRRVDARHRGVDPADVEAVHRVREALKGKRRGRKQISIAPKRAPEERL